MKSVRELMDMNSAYREVGGAEGARRPGLGQGGGTGQGPGLALEDLQVVVEDQILGALVQAALVASHHLQLLHHHSRLLRTAKRRVARTRGCTQPTPAVAGSRGTAG